MAWTLSLPHIFYGRHREGGSDIIEDLTVSVNENYFTFRKWDEGGSVIKPDGLTERFSRNFDTFRQWGK